MWICSRLLKYSQIKNIRPLKAGLQQKPREEIWQAEVVYFNEKVRLKGGLVGQQDLSSHSFGDLQGFLEQKASATGVLGFHPGTSPHVEGQLLADAPSLCFFRGDLGLLGPATCAKEQSLG